MRCCHTDGSLSIFDFFSFAPQAKEDQGRAKLSPRPSLDSPLPLCMAQGEAFPLRIPFWGLAVLASFFVPR